MRRKKSKYGSSWKKCNEEHNHQSKKEANRCNELHLLLKAGEIEKLKIQPKFELLPSFEYNDKKYRGIHYYADFSYFDKDKKIWVVEDVKGHKTNVYKLKKKMLLNMLKDAPIEFLET
jgi:hypothetical protein